MGNKLSKIRNRKMKAQSGLCLYCRQPMWNGDRADFCKRFGLSAKQAANHQCTAEHLHAKSEGGKDRSENIAACLFCNRTRHLSKKPLPPGAYSKKVRKQLAAGKWHGFVAPAVLATPRDCRSPAT